MILGWIILSFVVAFIGSDRKIGYWGTFFLSLLLSPIIGAIFALASQRNIQVSNYRIPVYESVRDESISETSNDNNRTSNAEQLEKLAALKEKGILTEDEFIQEKKKIIGVEIEDNIDSLNEQNSTENKASEKKKNFLIYKNGEEKLLKGFRYLVSSNYDENIHNLLLINSNQISFNNTTCQFNDYQGNIFLIIFYIKSKSDRIIYDGNYSIEEGNVYADAVLNQNFNLEGGSSIKFSSCNFRIKEWDNIFEISFNGTLESHEEIEGNFTGEIEHLRNMDRW